MRSTRSSVRPVRSRAARVFSKVGASVPATMASISRRCSASAASNAPGKCSGAMRSHGGTPPYGPAQGAINGLSDTKRNVTATRLRDAGPPAGEATPTSLRSPRTRSTPRVRCGGCCARMRRSNSTRRQGSSGDRECGGRSHQAARSCGDPFAWRPQPRREILPIDDGTPYRRAWSS